MARKALFPASVKPGIPEQQPVPQGWSRVQFGDVLQVIERPIKLENDKEYQLVTARRSRGGVVHRERLLGRQVLTKTQFRTKEGDFLISRRQIIHGACGIVPLYLDGSVVSNEYATLRAKPNLDPEFLSYLSHTRHFQQCCFYTSVGVDVEKMVFKLEKWLKESFNLPPLPEQRNIASILRGIDEVINKTRDVIEQVSKVRLGILEELMTRAAGHGLYELGTVVSGSRYGTSSKCHDEPAGLPVLRIPNVVSGKICFDDIKFANLPDEEVARLKLIPGDILVVRTNGNPNLIGRCAVVPEHEGTLVYASYLIRLRLDQKVANPNFISIALQQHEIRQHINQTARTSAGNYNINANDLSAIRLPLPPLNMQNAMVDVIDAIEQRLDIEQRTLSRLAQMREGLIEQFFSGSVRTTNLQHSADLSLV